MAQAPPARPARVPFALQRTLLLVLLAAAIVPYFLDLGGSSIWDANEAFYVETPREMIERGDYVGPTFNYEPRFNKPVLSYWIVAGFYHVFGISVGAQRLPIAIAAIGLIACAWWLAVLARPPDVPARESTAALWAALGLAVAPRLLMFGRRIFIDVYISLFMALTLVCFAAAERYPARRRLFLTLMYVVVGLGTLTKGPVAVLLPALAFLIYLAVYRELGRLREMRLAGGAVIALAIVLPWYVALYHRYGWTYITSFLVGENLDRFATGAGVRVDRAPWFYLPVLFTDSFPFSLFLVPAVMAWWRGRADRAGRPPLAPERVRTLLWIWIATIVGFFTLSAAKQDLYIFPVVPAVMALAALSLERLGRDDRDAAAHRLTLLIEGVLLGAVGIGLLYLFRTMSSTYSLAGVLAIALTGVAGGIAVGAFAWRRQLFASAATLAAAFVLVAYAFVLRTLPSFEIYKPVPAFAAILSERATADDIVATYDQALPSLVYYLRRHVVEVFEPEPLAELLASPREVNVVMAEGDFTALRPSLPAGVCVISRQPTFDVKLKNVLARAPLPQLVLVSNRCP